MEMTFSHHPNSYEHIATQFCTWNDSAEKLCIDIPVRDGIATKENLHRIWMAICDKCVGEMTTWVESK